MEGEVRYQGGRTRAFWGARGGLSTLRGAEKEAPYALEAEHGRSRATWVERTAACRVHC